MKDVHLKNNFKWQTFAIINSQRGPPHIHITGIFKEGPWAEWSQGPASQNLSPPRPTSSCPLPRAALCAWGLCPPSSPACFSEFRYSFKGFVNDRKKTVHLIHTKVLMVNSGLICFPSQFIIGTIRAFYDLTESDSGNVGTYGYNQSFSRSSNIHWHFICSLQFLLVHPFALYLVF